MTPLSLILLAVSVCGVSAVIVACAALRLSGIISAAQEAIDAMCDDDGEML